MKNNIGDTITDDTKRRTGAGVAIGAIVGVILGIILGSLVMPSVGVLLGAAGGFFYDKYQQS